MGKVMRHTLGASLNIRHNLSSSKGPKPLQLKLLTTYIPKTSAFTLVFFSSRRLHTSCLSDWSSDVCSSDLVVSVVVSIQLDHVHPRVLSTLQQVVTDLQRCAVPIFVPHRVRHAGQGEHRPQDGRLRSVQIGRASCREREEIGVGAGPA